MRIAYITAGAGGMYCGSCMKDNALATAINQLGHECLLIPCYTPLRLDDSEASNSPVFLSGLTLFLQEKYTWLRKLPGFLSRLLAQPWLLKKVTGSTVKIEASQLAPMTLSLLRGTNGHQKQEIQRLTDWLAREVKPDIVLITAALISGIIPELKRALGVPILTTLQGDDIFLEELPAEPRAQAIALIQQNCTHTAGHIATCQYYADFMANYLGLARETIHVVYPGINLHGFPTERQDAGVDDTKRSTQPLTIGYLARIAPEKGFHLLVDALCLLNRQEGLPPWRFRAAGYLAGYRKNYLEEKRNKAVQDGWGDRFEYLGEPNRIQKVEFLQTLDLLSVPTLYREPKGLYVLEALACGVPAVLPRHGSFPEWIELTGGGLLVEPNDAQALANGLVTLLRDDVERRRLGMTGQKAVHTHHSAKVMAEETMKVLTAVTGK